jgi:quinol monooxygenase YgiN
MHARVIRTKIRPDRFDEAGQLFRDEVLAAANEQPELSTIALLGSRETGDGITFALWQTEQAMRAAQESGWTQQQVGRFASMLVAEPTIESFEVSVRDRPVTQEISHARVVTVQITPDRLDEAVAIYQDSVVPTAKEHNGYLGALLLTDRSTGKGVSIVAWASEADLKASDSSGYLQAQLAKFSELFTAPPTVEVFEVAAVRLGA